MAPITDDSIDIVSKGPIAEDVNLRSSTNHLC